MKIRLKQNRKRRIVFRYDLENRYLADLEIEVLAVMRNHCILQYLIRCSTPGNPDALDWVSAKNFIITDLKRPENWVEYTWPRWKRYVKTHSDYDFDFRLSYYCGPSVLLESDTFLFESVYEPDSATRYLHQYMGNTTDCFDKPLTDFFLEHPQEEVVVVRIMSK